MNPTQPTRSSSRPTSRPATTGSPDSPAGRARDAVPPPAAAVRVDPEFRRLIPPLSTAEYASLERRLLHEGCRVPLVVWAGRGLLLDGHNRLEICRKHGLPFRTIEKDLPDREAARAWILAEQSGRRNLTPDGLSYVRGQSYRARTCQGRRTDLLTCDQNAHKRTCEQLAQEYRVSSGTIRRDARFAEAVDTVVASCGAEAKRLILTREARLTRADVVWWAGRPAQQQRGLLAEVQATGRLNRPKDSKRPGPLVLPRDPETLGQALRDRLDAAQLAAVRRALGMDT